MKRLIPKNLVNLEFDFMKLRRRFTLLLMSAIVLMSTGLWSNQSFAESSSDVIQPAGVSSNDLPSIGGGSAQSAAEPSNPPGDLAGLSKKLTQSVVTVFCTSGNDLGSGWAASVEMSPAMKAAGYRSYIVTNLHVVAACTTDSSIEMRLSSGETIHGKVWSWSDTDHDVAGIVTNATVPALTWRGKIPAQGWWVGVIGSPLGQPGLLSTGIISSVALAAGGPNNFPAYTGTTTAPINHGNSGGPVFDSSGRVLGLATAVAANAQNIGIFNGTPMLCDVVINCPSQTAVWGDGPLPGTGSSNLLILILIGVSLLAAIGVLVFIVSRKNGGPKGPRPQNIYGVTTTFNVNPTGGLNSQSPPSTPGAPPAPPKF
jgi:LPXTG-motif cell wall-anchored protein